MASESTSKVEEFITSGAGIVLLSMLNIALILSDLLMTWAAAAHWIHNQYHLAVVYEGNPFFFSDIKSILLIALIFFPLLTLIKNEKLNEFMGVLNLVLIPVLLVPVIWNIIVIWG